MTVNPLLGSDSVRPFLQREDRGALLVARSSNPGAADLLDARLESGMPVSARIVELGLSWDPGGAVGFVVGATSPEAVAAIRRAAPDAPLLLPGRRRTGWRARGFGPRRTRCTCPRSGHLGEQRDRRSAAGCGPRSARLPRAYRADPRGGCTCMTVPLALIRNDDQAAHVSPGHPERPDRVLAILDGIAADAGLPHCRGWWLRTDVARSPGSSTPTTRFGASRDWR